MLASTPITPFGGSAAPQIYCRKSRATNRLSASASSWCPVCNPSVCVPLLRKCGMRGFLQERLLCSDGLEAKIRPVFALVVVVLSDFVACLRIESYQTHLASIAVCPSWLDTCFAFVTMIVLRAILYCGTCHLTSVGLRLQCPRVELFLPLMCKHCTACSVP